VNTLEQIARKTALACIGCTGSVAEATILAALREAVEQCARIAAAEWGRNGGAEHDLTAAVAADVAQALELTPRGKVYWEDEVALLDHDGKKLTDDHWRCCCEDFLLENGWSFRADATYLRLGRHEAAEDVHDIFTKVFVDCPWPEAPARLVSAVWRKQQEGKS